MRLLFVFCLSSFFLPAVVWGVDGCWVFENPTPPKLQWLREIPSRTGAPWRFALGPDVDDDEAMSTWRRLSRVLGPIDRTNPDDLRIFVTSSRNVKTLHLKPIEGERTFLITHVSPAHNADQSRYYMDLERAQRPVRWVRMVTDHGEALPFDVSYRVLLKIVVKHRIPLDKLKKLLLQVPDLGEPEADPKSIFVNLDGTESYRLVFKKFDRWKLITAYSTTPVWENIESYSRDDEELDLLLSFGERQAHAYRLLLGRPTFKMPVGSGAKQWTVTASYVAKKGLPRALRNEDLAYAIRHLGVPPVPVISNEDQLRSRTPYWGDYRALSRLPDGARVFVYFVCDRMTREILITALTRAKRDARRDYIDFELTPQAGHYFPIDEQLGEEPLHKVNKQTLHRWFSWAFRGNQKLR